MSRPFIEFIQAQQLDWAASTFSAIRPGTTTKPLSRDIDTGASSSIVRYPAGWRDEEGSVLSADEEVFILEGELTIGQTTHRRYSYAHLPAGFHRTGMRSGPGAVVLTFFSAEPERARANGHATDLVTERVIEKVDAFEGDWGGNFHPNFPPGAGRKWLRRDPVTGDETWILGTMPLRSGRRPERHPVVEEMLLLSGTLVGHVGEMRPGAYFWRPPEEWHGPFGSMTGNLMLFRTVGGPLSTEYTQDEVSFSWDVEHRPLLPPEFAELAPAPGCGCSTY